MNIQTLETRRRALQAQIADRQAELETLERRAARLDAVVSTLPEAEYFKSGDVLRFRKKFPGGGTSYTYAALKVGERWFLTGKSGQDAYSFDQLRAFLADGVERVELLGKREKWTLSG